MTMHEKLEKIKPLIEKLNLTHCFVTSEDFIQNNISYKGNYGTYSLFLGVLNDKTYIDILISKKGLRVNCCVSIDFIEERNVRNCIQELIKTHQFEYYKKAPRN